MRADGRVMWYLLLTSKNEKGASRPSSFPLKPFYITRRY